MHQNLTNVVTDPAKELKWNSNKYSVQGGAGKTGEHKPDGTSGKQVVRWRTETQPYQMSHQMKTV